MEQSILLSTKKILGVPDDYVVFDLDILTHINTAFFNLTQLGVGPLGGFHVEDDEAVWADFYADDVEADKYQAVKSYVYLKVRSMFDPPTTGYLVEATNKQMQELEWRLNTVREETEWVDPDPPVIVEG